MFVCKPRAALAIPLVLATLWILSWFGPSRPLAAAVQDAPKPLEGKKDTADEKTIRALIAQLADDAYEKREAADKRLAAIGEPALALLKKAAEDNQDAEVRSRAEILIKGISKGMFTQVRIYGQHQASSLPFASRVVVTPDGRRAVSVGGDALRCWDLATGNQPILFEERNGPLCWGMAISADGTRVIAGSHDKQAYVFDLATGKKIRTFSTHNSSVWGVALTADGKQALSGGDDKALRVWDVDSGKELRSFEGVVDTIRCLALSPNGKLVVTGHFSGTNRPGTVRLWDYEKGKEIHTMIGHKKEVACVAFSPDGKNLLSTSFDGTVRLWDGATGQEIKRLEGHTNRVEYAAFTPDGKRVISCGNMQDPTLRIWDVASGKQLLESEPVREGYHCVAVLPDGRQCVSVGRDGIVRLWQWKK
jgi:WD40 repeat protein